MTGPSNQAAGLPPEDETAARRLQQRLPGGPGPPAAAWLRRCAGVAWASFLVSVGLLWGQHRLGVLHPWAVPFVLLLAVTLLASGLGLAAASWRAVRGPGRRGALAGGAACALPACLWAAVAAYVLHLVRVGDFPKNTLTNAAGVAVASLMELGARCAYPSRVESDRLVMFYDGRVADPRRDLEAMDRHVAGLEGLTGRPLREKIYWVRGGLLGQGRMALAGLALGSDRSPADWETADHPDRLSVDRHELAHAVLHQHQPPDADPPALLVEGWAEAQSGTTDRRRAAWARESRDLWRGRTGAGPEASYLRELTGPVRYHRPDGPAYIVGGAFAGFLLRRYGPGPFLRLYFACRPGRFEAECRAQLGAEFEALESEFWADVERSAVGAGPGAGGAFPGTTAQVFRANAE
jgi:hypothetical protein